MNHHATVLGVANQKGGCGKTTFCYQFAVSCVRDGLRVLCIDADPQASLGIIRNIAIDHQYPFIPDLIAMPRSTIHQEIKSYVAEYDLILIDSGAGTNHDLQHASEQRLVSIIKAADFIIVPTVASVLDWYALDRPLELIRLRQHISGGQPTTAFVITHASSRSQDDIQLAQAIEARYADVTVFAEKMVQRMDYKRVLTTGRTVMDLVGKRHQIKREEGEALCAAVKKWLNLDASANVNPIRPRVSSVSANKHASPLSGNPNA